MSHPTGNENARNAASAMHEGGLLNQFWTCVGWTDRGISAKFLPKSIHTHLRRRGLDATIGSMARYVPFLEMIRLAAGRVPFGAANAIGCSIDDVYRNLDQIVAREVKVTHSARAVYCYEDGAFETFRIARNRGIKTLYELPMGYWRAWHLILEEESNLKPAWASTLQGSDDSEEKLVKKEFELGNADHVFVASSFARTTLVGSPTSGATFHQVSYGASSPTKQRRPRPGSDALKILFVGALTQRKGLSYLFDAVRGFGERVKLTLIGRVAFKGCSVLDHALKKHDWLESVPHWKVLQLMHEHDVLVFPSLFEGFGLVISEALSQGLPVITTPNTAGPDLISEGSNGFIVPIRSSEAISERIERLIMDGRLLADMKESALQNAKRSSWSAYRNSLICELRKCGL